MNVRTLAIIAGLSLLPVAGFAQETDAPKAAPAGSQKWEYMFVDGQFTKKVKLMSSRIEDDMKAANDLGAEGWELVATLPKTEPNGKPTPYFYYIYKRMAK